MERVVVVIIAARHNAPRYVALYKALERRFDWWRDFYPSQLDDQCMAGQLFLPEGITRVRCLRDLGDFLEKKLPRLNWAALITTTGG